MSKTVTITPNYEALTRYSAEAFATHGWDTTHTLYGPVAAFIELVRHLQATNPEALDRILDKVRANAATWDGQQS